MPQVTSATVRLRWLLWCPALASAAFLLVQALQLATHNHNDLDVYLVGARHLFDGTMYTNRSSLFGLPFLYPPIAGLAFLPLTWIKLKTAVYLWAVFNCVLLVGLIGVSLRAARPSMPWSRLLWWSLALAWPAYHLDPIFQTMNFAQINILLAFLIMGDLAISRQFLQRALPEGVLLGLAAAVKLTPLVFVPFLALAKRTRTAVTVVVTFAAATLLMFAVVPRLSWSFWTNYAFKASRVGVYYISDQNVQAAVVRINHALVPKLVVDVVVLAVGVSGVVVAAWAYRASSRLLGVLVAAATGLLVSPISWDHHMVWVVPVIGWLWLGHDRPKFGKLWAIATAVLFWQAPIWWVPTDNGTQFSLHGLNLFYGNSFFFATLLFVVGIAVMLTLRRRSSRADPTQAVVGNRAGNGQSEPPHLKEPSVVGSG
ncbi:MAG TPA: glycosyltransferase 87 family protein [Acidimicrobiales bacterium]